METEQDLLNKLTCCIPDCGMQAVVFDDMDNPFCADCHQQELDDYPIPGIK